MTNSLSIKIKWLDHLNTTWIGEKNKSLAERDGASEMYDRLLSNQEVIPIPNRVFYLKGLPVPDFDTEPLSSEEQEHYLDTLLNSQLTLARAVCSDSPFSLILQKRLIVLQRMFYAVTVKFHDQEKVRQQQQLMEAATRSESSKLSQDRFHNKMDALIEMGVKTGLSLVFSLLKQNWSMAHQLGGVASNIKVGNMCNDVLKTALDVICTFPPLSLANESKLPPLAVSTLSEITLFLKSAAMPNSGADAFGKTSFS